jgi:hypothetical protein
MTHAQFEENFTKRIPPPINRVSAHLKSQDGGIPTTAQATLDGFS